MASMAELAPPPPPPPPPPAYPPPAAQLPPPPPSAPAHRAPPEAPSSTGRHGHTNGAAPPRSSGGSGQRPPNKPHHHQSGKDAAGKQHQHRGAQHRSGSHHSGSKAQHGGKPALASASALAPAVGAGALGSALDNRLRRDTPFLATIRFKNDLPEVPGDPNLLVMQQPPDRLAGFALTTMEKERKPELIMPPDLGISLSLLDVERYQVPVGKLPLHPADQALLGPDAEQLLLPGSAPLAGLSKATLGLGGSPVATRRNLALRSAAEVSWLMRTTYISADGDGGIRYKSQYNAEHETVRQKQQQKKQELLQQHGAAPTDAALLLEVSENADEETQRQAQIRAIEASFAATRQPPVHRTKPHMRAVEVMEVLPDLEHWGQVFVQAHFDKDPAGDVDEFVELQDSELSMQLAGRSFLKGFRTQDSSNQDAQQQQGKADGRLMALLVPYDVVGAATALQEHGDSGLAPDDLVGEYCYAMEYTYEMGHRKGAATAGDRQDGKQALSQYLMRFAGSQVLYWEINRTMELRKRDMTVSKARAQAFARPSKVTIRKREVTEREQQEAKRRRLAVLLSGTVTEADDDEEEQEQGGGAQRQAQVDEDEGEELGGRTAGGRRGRAMEDDEEEDS